MIKINNTSSQHYIFRPSDEKSHKGPFLTCKASIISINFICFVMGIVSLLWNLGKWEGILICNSQEIECLQLIIPFHWITYGMKY